MIKRLMSLMLCLAMVAVFAGCGGQDAPDGPEEENVLTIGFGIDIEGMNSFNAFETKHSALSMVYDTLLLYEDGKVKPNLVESWEVSGDKSEYTLRLREGISFSDGEKLDAKAVKLNLQVLKKNPMYEWMGALSRLREISIEDEYTVKLVYDGPYAFALYDLCSYQPMCMASPNIIRDGDEPEIVGTVGTGPYVYSDYEKDSYYTFTRNENYWGEKPEFEKVVLKIIHDPDARLMALKSGDIDMVLGSDFISYDAFHQMQQDKNFRAEISDTVVRTRNLLLNSSSEILGDIRVRKAIQHAIDKDEFVNSLLYGIEKKADFLFDKSLPHCDVGAVTYEYSIQKANELLDEAGWIIEEGESIRSKDGKALKLSLTYPTDMVLNESMAQVIKGYLKKVGIDVSLSGNEMMTWYADSMDGKFDMTINNTYGTPYDPHVFLGTMTGMSADSVAQRGLVAKGKLDENINAVFSKGEDEKIEGAFGYILTTLGEEAVNVPLSYQRELVIYSPQKLDSYEFGGLAEMINVK